jgi:hypothetical protein
MTVNMRECWNMEESERIALMDSGQLRAMANFIRGFHGADSFVAALEDARSHSVGGELETASVWNQIAEEISQMETCEVLARCLKRGN